ncbi:B12-binding domain-containing radical SAM protein [Myxococcota bacterium]|nr:B12-binding domain-containing radical SAM protein [Myxococcota bacterium]
MAEVLVAHNSFLAHDPAEREAMRPWTPLGPLYAAAALRAAGHGVRFWDATFARDEGEFGAAVGRPRVVVLIADPFNVPQKMCLRRPRRAAFAMVEAARGAGARVVVGGPDAASHPEEYLRAGAHLVVPGEAEAALVELVPRLAAGEDGRDVAGVGWLDEAGAYARGPERARASPLESLPHPARDLVDMDRYLSTWRDRHGVAVTNLVASRGCPFQCNWCAKPVFGRRYTLRAAADVVDEVRTLKEVYGAERLWYADELFGLDRHWLRSLREGLVAAGVVVPYEAVSRVDIVDDAVARDLRDSGCTSVWVGAESGSQRVLDAMEKGTTVEAIAAARRALGAAGIEVGFFLQFGYPGEGMEDIDRTIRMVRDARPDRIGISVSLPLPGTPFYERVRHQDRVPRGWEHSMECELLHDATYGPDFYKVLRRLVHKDFALARTRAALVDDLRALPRGDPRALGRLPRLIWQAASRTALRARLLRLASPRRAAA